MFAKSFALMRFLPQSGRVARQFGVRDAVFIYFVGKIHIEMAAATKHNERRVNYVVKAEQKLKSKWLALALCAEQKFDGSRQWISFLHYISLCLNDALIELNSSHSIKSSSAAGSFFQRPLLLLCALASTCH